jgi:hypothetical protein
MSSRDLLAMVFALALAVTPAHAQPLNTVPFGRPMRIATCTGAMLVGTFGGVRGDSIALAMDSVVTSTVTFPPERMTIARVVPTACVRSYSVLEGVGRRTGTGALVGAGLGLAFVGWAWAEDRAYERKGGAAMIPGTAFAVPIALVLTGVGAWIGSVSGPERWSTPQGLAAEFRAVPRGLGAGVSVRF